MSLKWTDVLDIAIELDEAHPDVDPLRVNFVDLMNWVMRLCRTRPVRPQTAPFGAPVMPC